MPAPKSEPDVRLVRETEWWEDVSRLVVDGQMEVRVILRPPYGLECRSSKLDPKELLLRECSLAGLCRQHQKHNYTHAIQ